MFSTFGLWDYLLILGVCGQTTALAYTHNPRTKAFIYGLPFPFTLAALAIGRPIDATNVCASLLLLLYTQVVRLLCVRFGWPIVLSIVAGVIAFCAMAFPLAALLPSHELGFWISAFGCMAFSTILLRFWPERDEPGHKTPLPVWIKIPIIVAVVVGLVCVKKWMHGFATAFPMVGVVGAYEARHSLYTLGRQIPIVMLTVIPMMMAWHLAQPLFGLPIAVGLGWLVYGLAMVVVSAIIKRGRSEEMQQLVSGALASKHSAA